MFQGNGNEILPFTSLHQDNVDRIRYRFESVYEKAKQIAKQVQNDAHNFELQNAKILKSQGSSSNQSKIVHQPPSMVDINVPVRNTQRVCDPCRLCFQNT